MTYLYIFLITYAVGFLITFGAVGWQRYESRSFNWKNKFITAAIWPLFLLWIKLT